MIAPVPPLQEAAGTVNRSAERVGFEPTVPLRVHYLSRVANSTTLAPLRTKLLCKYTKKNPVHFYSNYIGLKRIKTYPRASIIFKKIPGLYPRTPFIKGVERRKGKGEKRERGEESGWEEREKKGNERRREGRKEGREPLMGIVRVASKSWLRAC